MAYSYYQATPLLLNVVTNFSITSVTSVTSSTACCSSWDTLELLGSMLAMQNAIVAAPPTPEELEAARAAAAVYNEERKKAKTRANALLISLLNEQQRAQFEEFKSFDLVTNGRVYRIQPGRKVQQMDPATQKAITVFCIQPEFNHNLPDEDIAISQKLFLETDEAAFLATANEWKVGTGDTPIDIQAPILPPYPDELAVAEQAMFEPQAEIEAAA